MSGYQSHVSRHGGRAKERSIVSMSGSIALLLYLRREDVLYT
jgi:hypothetical protein